MTTLYYLLLKKFIKNGHISNSDISSLTFKPKVLADIAEMENAVKNAVRDDSKPSIASDEQLKNRRASTKEKVLKVDVNDILNKHHQRIKEKVEKRTKKKMNNTTIMSYEENIRDVSKSPTKNTRFAENDPLNMYRSDREAADEKKRKRNRTQVIKGHDDRAGKIDAHSVSREPKSRRVDPTGIQALVQVS